MGSQLGGQLGTGDTAGVRGWGDMGMDRDTAGDRGHGWGGHGWG